MSVKQKLWGILRSVSVNLIGLCGDNIAGECVEVVETIERVVGSFAGVVGTIEGGVGIAEQLKRRSPIWVIGF